MSITVQQLRTLVAVVDEGSFTHAALVLGNSQSAVSHAVAALERELGGPVVERDDPLVPTPLGLRVLPHARTAVAAITAVEVAARGDRALAGSVRLGAVPTVCQGLVPQLLDEWRGALPDVRVEVVEGDDDEMPVWLENGFVDVAVLVDPPKLPPGAKLIAIDEYAAVVPDDHPLAGLAEIPLEELAEDGVIVTTGGCEAHVRDMHEAVGLTFAARHRVRDIGSMFAMVQRGFGVSIVPSFGRKLVPDGMRMLPVIEGRARRHVIAVPQEREPHPIAVALVEAAIPQRSGVAN
ncbi:LysR family transcriptional regulator [Leucobacter sp. NPDC015123]|uniref:LysR family transcriptional regulator n=1 Tax=Leucobacter sp. NPDC015123 TaxID=3364129 RepID=UPI0036F48F2A